MLQCVSCHEMIDSKSDAMTAHATIEDTCMNCLYAQGVIVNQALVFQGAFVHNIRHPLYIKMDSDVYRRRYLS
jgi:hypothetical protein